MKYTCLFLLLFGVSILHAQPSIQWQKCYGGTGNDEPGGMIQTRDGGYIMSGATHSANGDVTSNHGNLDLWVIKINARGAIEWQKTYGGSQDDNAGAIIESLDGGYIIASSTNSSDGDLTGVFHGDSTESDVWVLKIDSLGTIEWQKTFGGSKNDFATSIVSGGEGEYVISAVTNSSDGDVKGYHGGSGFDIWLFQISETGNLGWQKTFGGTKDDEGAVIQTNNGGLAVIGTTFSNDGDVAGRHTIDTLSGDVWLLHLDNNGALIWQKTYGGSGYDAGYDAIETSDHGYVIAASTSSPNNGDVSGNHQTRYFSDCWIVKLDSTGAIQWQKTLGGSQGDAAFSVIQTSESGYIVSGNTASNDDDVIGEHGSSDCWVFKLSKTGDLLWQKTLGGSASDANYTSGIMPASDSGYLVLTTTWSNDGDVSGLHGDSNNADIWIVKLSPDLSEVKDNYLPAGGSISVNPNPCVGKTTVTYDLDKLSYVKIELFNTIGEKLRFFIDANEESGIHAHEFDLSSVPAGNYFLRIEIAGKSVLKAVELMK